MVITLAQVCRAGLKRRTCGHIRAEIYEKDNYESLHHFLQQYLPKDAEILLFEWGKEYPGLQKKYPNLIFNSKYWFGDKEYMTEIREKLSQWLKGLSLINNNRIQLHINECIFICYYEYLTLPMLLYYIVKFNMKVKLKKRKPRVKKETI